MHKFYLCTPQDGTVRTYFAFLHWLLPLPPSTAELTYPSFRSRQGASVWSAWGVYAGSWVLRLVTDCCPRDLSADPSPLVVLVLEQGRVCSVLTTHPAWVQSLAVHPVRLWDTVMSVHGAFTKFKVPSCVKVNQHGTLFLVSWSLIFRKPSGGNNLLTQEDCLNTMVGMAMVLRHIQDMYKTPEPADDS